MTVERYDSIRGAEKYLRETGGNGSSSQTFSVLRAVERCFWRCLPYRDGRNLSFSFRSSVDLSRGDERYKLDFGGVLYSTESVQVCTEVPA